MAPLRRPNGSPATTLGVTPNQHHSNAPRIGGSEAGKLALSLRKWNIPIIVIAASAGIYFLLRYGEPSAAERTARRKYSIRRRGVHAHPLPIGLPGSFGEKISNVFKGRRAASGWVPARDEEDEWATTDEPLRERHHHEAAEYQRQRDEFSRVGSAPVSRPAMLTEPSDAAALVSRSASHVDADGSSVADFGRNASPILSVPAPSMPTPEPEEEWLNAGESRPTVRDGGGRGAHPMGYFAPQPRRADSGDIPLFAGSVPFR
ncbi:hypothetical protein BJV78DRAFT_759738 [Lactifluus subvellereus]|nr:hypothetical protein BJV78DRAFT_759738 [Lactifluus subvellereus]